MEKRQFKKLPKTTNWGGKVYAYRGFEVQNITSPNATYGEWYARVEISGQSRRVTSNTREGVAEKIDRLISKVERV